MRSRVRKSGLAVVLGLVAVACGLSAEPAVAMGSWIDAEPVADNCANEDGALDAAFVIVATPRAGQRVESGFTVTGCSRTFESNVQWRLLGRNGAELARGHAPGGGVDGPGPFSFAVAYSVEARQIGHLEVFEEDVSDGEGFPPGRTILPLVLLP
jgi:hypothetical protein